MPKELLSQLKRLKTHNGRINPDLSWVAGNRERMLSQISVKSAEASRGFELSRVWQAMSIFVPSRFVYAVVRPLMVFLVVGAVATSGWIASVSATDDCLPGDICYGVKMAVEKTQQIVMSVTGSEQEETKMHLEFASRRAKEVQKVVEKKNDAAAPQKAQVAVAKLEKSLQSANEGVKKVSEKTPEKVLEVSQEVQEKTTMINQALQEAEKQDRKVDMSNAKQLAQDTSLSAVEAVVQRKEEGKVIVSDEILKNIVEIKIEEAVSNASTTMAKVDKLNQSEASTTTVSTTVNTAVAEAVKTMDQTGAQVQKDLAEAKSLSDNNQLMEAIQKVKEVSQVTTEVEKVVSEVKKAVAETASASEAAVSVTTTITSTATSSVITSTPAVVEPARVK